MKKAPPSFLDFIIAYAKARDPALKDRLISQAKNNLGGARAFIAQAGFYLNNVLAHAGQDTNLLNFWSAVEAVLVAGSAEKDKTHRIRTDELLLDCIGRMAEKKIRSRLIQQLSHIEYMAYVISLGTTDARVKLRAESVWDETINKIYAADAVTARNLLEDRIGRKPVERELIPDFVQKKIADIVARDIGDNESRHLGNREILINYIDSFLARPTRGARVARQNLTHRRLLH